MHPPLLLRLAAMQAREDTLENGLRIQDKEVQGA
jgi:hypothetical protein